MKWFAWLVLGPLVVIEAVLVSEWLGVSLLVLVMLVGVVVGIRDIRAGRHPGQFTEWSE